MDGPKPEFNEDAELFKLQIISNYHTSSHIAQITGYIAAVIAWAIFLLQTVRDIGTYYISLAFGGGAVLLAIFFQEVIPYRNHIRWMSKQIEKVKKEESLPSLADLWKEGKLTWRFWEGNGAEGTRSKSRRKSWILLRPRF